MNWSSLRSHADQIEMLRRSIQRGRLAHTYLFAGPAGVGKSLFARILAQCLLCERVSDEHLDACGECSSCRQMAASSHPDFFYIGCPEGKGEIPVAAFLGEKEKRGQEGLIHDISLRPMIASRRVAIIDDANRMNEEGANAMLKTLEEPPADSLLILIAENLDAILPTIRSRCQLLRFAGLPEKDVAELLAQHELAATSDEATAAASMSDGSLQTAQQLLNPELRRLREQLYEHLSAADLQPIEAAKAMTAGVESVSGNTQEQRQNAGWLIRFAQEFYRQSTLVLSGNSPPVVPREVEIFCKRQAKRESVGLELTMTLFDQAVTAENRVSWNVNPLRTLEALFDDLSMAQRK
jgi:DNA polymerase III subunit delta'